MAEDEPTPLRDKVRELRGALDAATTVLRTSTFVYLTVWA